MRVAGGAVAVTLMAVVGIQAIGQAHAPGRRLGQQFVSAWARQDYPAMYALLDPVTRRRVSLTAFTAAYRHAAATAAITSLTAGPVPHRHAGTLTVPVSVQSGVFGTLNGTVRLRVDGAADKLAIAWSAGDVFPGLRHGERLTHRLLAARRGDIVAADGSRLSPDNHGGRTLSSALAEIGGSISRAGPAQEAVGRDVVGVSGLERVYDARLAGRAAVELLAGHRLIARVSPRAGGRIHTTIVPKLQQAAVSALGTRAGGIAVIRPSSGAVLALAGIALSGRQPPGSTFKIITATAALQAGLTSVTHTYPTLTSTTLSGVTLRNANNEACGGTLANAFAVSCNSVFAPLGARIGATRLISTAEAFGFNDRPRLPDEVRSTIPDAHHIGDALAVGSSAIGQGQVLATPLQMATVAATVAAHGQRARARLLSDVPVVRKRVMSARVARQVRTLMLAVVEHGTGTSAAISGVPIAGKTGTAELKTTTGGGAAPDPASTDAWFVAFPATAHPRVAIAVMLLGDGAGGATAAPVAREVLRAALGSGA